MSCDDNVKDLTQGQKAGLSEDDQALVRSGMLDAELDFTRLAEKNLVLLLCKKHKKELVKVANKAIAKHEARKAKQAKE